MNKMRCPFAPVNETVVSKGDFSRGCPSGRDSNPRTVD